MAEDFRNADYIADMPEEPKEENLNIVEEAELLGIIKSRFQAAASGKQPHEDRMIEAYNNFRGIYGKSRPAMRASEKSNIFVKATKTKTLAAYGQIVDITLGGETIPIRVRPTQVPEGADDVAHVSAEESPMQKQPAPMEEEEKLNPFNIGFKGDGREVPPGATFGSKIKKLLNINQDPKDKYLKPGRVEGKPTYNPAQMAADRMDKLIHDQLEESNSIGEISNATFESVMLGTGVIKGPFTYVKTLHKWVKDDNGNRVYKPIRTKVPRLEFVSVWDAYPDPNATCKEEMSYFIHRHRMNESQLRGLKNMPKFDSKAIMRVLEMGPNYQKQSYEHSIRSSAEEGPGNSQEDRYEVLEYWGTMGAKEAKQVGLKVDEDLGEIQVNAWICGNEILRVAANPFVPARIPYHIFNYEKNPYSIFGIGVPENMSDSQQMMNGHARMAVDNLALAGNLVFDIDETALVPGQDMEIYNGKIFVRQAGQAGQAVYGIKFPNTAQENMMMFDKFRQLADEETGIPSYSHGATGVTGMTRTASGMSMLMGAASLTIKTVIKNIDNQLLKPLGDDFFQWNMQFFEGDLEIEGDLEVRAEGTNSLMQKEVRSQRLTQFLQIGMNPVLAPFINIPYIVEELAISLDLDRDRVINSTEEARLAAEILGMTNGQTASSTVGPAGQQPTDMGPLGAVPGGAGAIDPTGAGNGNIGTGVAPQPGEEEFSGQA